MKTELLIGDFDDDFVTEELFEDSRVAKIIDEMDFTDDDNFFDETDIQRELTGIYWVFSHQSPNHLATFLNFSILGKNVLIFRK